MKTFLFAAAAALAFAVPATAPSPRWSVAFNVGADIPLAGDVHDGGTGRVLNLPTTVHARDYKDITEHRSPGRNGSRAD